MTSIFTADAIRNRFTLSANELRNAAPYLALRDGKADQADYDRFIQAVFRAHVRSPKLVAFLYALAPPGDATDHLLHNLCEELGLEDGETAHPEYLVDLLKAADLGAHQATLQAAADHDLRRYSCDPLLFGTLKEVGFAVLAEIVSFEFMLSRIASEVAGFLSKYRGLDAAALVWFTHHSEVDIAHAEEGVASLLAYADWYDIDADDAQVLLDMTFRENVFIKRYFGMAEFVVPGGGTGAHAYS